MMSKKVNRIVFQITNTSKSMEVIFIPKKAFGWIVMQNNKMMIGILLDQINKIKLN